MSLCMTREQGKGLRPPEQSAGSVSIVMGKSNLEAPARDGRVLVAS